MSIGTYEELLGELFPRLGGGIRWGLDRTRRLLSTVGDPHLACPTLHVGGTNGKGSVAATLASVLAAAGHRTGLYTSPHLCSFRERIRVGGVPIEADALLAAAERLWPAVEREGASFFEATTAIGFLALAEAGVDVAVIEVGLGGRLDSTNVVEPEVSVLTNVALDHAEYLGTTLESVAREKAGIIKAGVPVVTAETDPAVLEVFAARAEEVGTTLHRLRAEEVEAVRTGLDGTRFRLDGREYRTPLIGPHQAVNAALAVRALGRLGGRLAVGEADVASGVERTRWPGRLQVERHAGATWVFDVAHNPAGVGALVAALEALPLDRPLVALVGILGDKDWGAMLPPLADLADTLILSVPPTAPPGRGWDPAGAARAAGVEAEVVPDFAGAIRAAHARAAAAGGTVCVTGSFHTVGDALAMLGLAGGGCDLPLPHVVLEA